MSEADACLYVGRVVHHRLRPRAHRLSYRHAMLLADVDGLDALAGRLRLFAYNRFALFSLHARDYGAGDGASLRSHVEAQLRAAGMEPDGGPIRLLTIPRLLGYAFNPLSLYFCHRRDGTLRAILYEVNNTFGQRHAYLLPAAPGPDGTVRQSCGKNFYVSPFLDMDLAYRFRVRPPGEEVAVSVAVDDRDGPLLTAIFAGRRRAMTDAALARLALAFPLLTVKVIAGIHWEALRLWLKGLRLRPRPAPPATPVSFPRRSHSPRMTDA